MTKTKRTLLRNEQKLKTKLNSNISSKLGPIIPAVFGICEGYIVYNMLQIQAANHSFVL
jgi:hypothetical protein